MAKEKTWGDIALALIYHLSLSLYIYIYCILPIAYY